MGGESRLLPEGLHKAFMVSNTLIYLLCKPLLRALAVPYEALVPEHTQYALFQLYCDLRANPIKDRHWFEVHARRLKPHTFPGWVALGSALLYILSGVSLALCMALSLLAGTIYATVFLVASAGIVIALITGLVAFSLLATACVASCAATSAAVGYGSLATMQAVLGWLSAMLLPKPTAPYPDIPDAPHLKPVATPRAPVLPDPAPAVNPASPRINFSVPPLLPVGAPVSALTSSLPPAPLAPSVPEGVSIMQVYTPDALDPIVEDAQLEAALAEQVASARAIIGSTNGGEESGCDDSASESSTAAVKGSTETALRAPAAAASREAMPHINGTSKAAVASSTVSDNTKRSKSHSKANGKASPKKHG